MGSPQRTSFMRPLGSIFWASRIIGTLLLIINPLLYYNDIWGHIRLDLTFVSLPSIILLAQYEVFYAFAISLNTTFFFKKKKKFSRVKYSTRLYIWETWLFIFPRRIYFRWNYFLKTVIYFTFNHLKNEKIKGRKLYFSIQK